MPRDEKYIKSAENTMKKYKDKISTVETELKKFESKGKKNLVSKSNELKEKYKEAEKIVKSLKESNSDNFEDLKNTTLDLFSDIRDGFVQLSSLITMDKIIHAKDEIAEYGKEKVSEAESYARKNPVTTAAIILAVGFVAGQFLRRSK